jgi:hypothetical protein
VNRGRTNFGLMNRPPSPLFLRKYEEQRAYAAANWQVLILGDLADATVLAKIGSGLYPGGTFRRVANTGEEQRARRRESRGARGNPAQNGRTVRPAALARLSQLKLAHGRYLYQ